MRMMQPAARRFCVVKQHNVQRMRVCRLLLKAAQPPPQLLIRPILPLLPLLPALPPLLLMRALVLVGRAVIRAHLLLPLLPPPLRKTL